MGFKTIIALKGYLTTPNLLLLDVVLRGLTSPAEKAVFQTFWGWFARQEGMSTAQVEHAVRSLGALRKILREYLEEQG